MGSKISDNIKEKSKYFTVKIRVKNKQKFAQLSPKEISDILTQSLYRYDLVSQKRVIETRHGYVFGLLV